MSEILALLQNLAPLVCPVLLHHLGHVIYGMLISNGRMTMLEISRWTESGGSYRTIQRLYHTPLEWLKIHWLFFTHQLHQEGHEYLAVGDEVVVSKAGTATHGLGRFFSSLQNQVIPGLAFFSFSLVDVTERQAYPIHCAQIVKEPPASVAAAQPKPTPEKKTARAVGRPKGSKNKHGQPRWNAELLRLQPILQAFLALLKGVVVVQYLVMDGHFGNFPSAAMVLQTGLQFISKLRTDAALYEPFTGPYSGHGRRRKYGDRLLVPQIKKKYLQREFTEDGLRTQIYQATLLNREFAFPLNVVLILKTRLATGKQAHVLLFSTDLQLAYDKMMDYYTLRFQIEFVFRDAKQYWGLEDFMNVKEVAVTNAAQLAFFMVNFSAALLRRYRAVHPAFSVLDLKAHYRGCRYVTETIKLLPNPPEGILLDEIFEQIARLGMIHPVSVPVSTT